MQSICKIKHSMNALLIIRAILINDDDNRYQLIYIRIKYESEKESPWFDWRLCLESQALCRSNFSWEILPYCFYKALYPMPDSISRTPNHYSQFTGNIGHHVWWYFHSKSWVVCGDLLKFTVKDNSIHFIW